MDPANLRVLSNKSVHPAWGGVILGVALTASCYWFLYSDAMWQFGLYLAMLSLFHLLEFVMTAIFHPDTLSFDSFLINQSREYQLCVLFSWTEYWGGSLLLPAGLKTVFPVVALVSCLCVCCNGQSFTHLVHALAALLMASRLFAQVARKKEDSHILVTSGLFNHIRHPAYFGHFWLSMGLQLMLMNPFSLALYAYGLHGFFSRRIAREEQALVDDIFGDQYAKYRDQTPTLIPFIK